MCTDLWSACLLHAVGSALHKLQHALDGITDLHQSLNVPSSFMREVGAVSTTVWAPTVPVSWMRT